MAINESIKNLINTNRNLNSTDIRNMFWYYYHKQPSQADLKYWEGKKSSNLSTALERGALLNKDKPEFQAAGYYKDVVAAEQPGAVEQPGAFKNEQPKKFEDLDIDISGLSKEEVDIAKSIYEISLTNDKAAAEDMITSMARAKNLADPYYKQQLSIAREYLQNTVRGSELGYKQTEQDLKQKLADINEDLEFNRGQLTLEQQADLAREARDYGRQLNETRNAMALRGLSSSSIRNQEEEYMAANYQDIVESTQRKYDRELRAQETQAARSSRDTQLGLDRLAPAREIAYKEFGLKAEEQFGSQNLAGVNIPTYNQMGGIAGAQTESYLSNLLNIGETFKKGSILNFS